MDLSRLPVLAGLAGLAAILLGCGKTGGPKPAPVEAPRVATYEGRGILREVSPERRTVRIAHEEIAGYMEAMTMEFDVAETVELSPYRAGQAVRFRLRITETRGEIDQLEKIDGPPANETEPTPREAEEHSADFRLIDAALIDQAGHPCRFQDWRGEALAITFIFTRCPYPTYCPLISKRFAEAQALLVQQHAEGWHFLSVTLDPAYDTPERLAEYAAHFHADAGHWTFLTGEAAEVRKLASACGVSVAERSGAIDHTLRTIVLDQRGAVRRIWPGNQWTPEELAAEVTAALGPVK
jgi:protein SCO1/2